MGKRDRSSRKAKAGPRRIPDRPGRTLEERANAIYREAQELARELWEIHSPAATRDDAPKIEVTLKPVYEVGDNESVPGPQEILNGLITAMAAVGPAGTLRDGAVYCHLCESAECAHSMPPAMRSVFAGYGTSGRPHWQEFANTLLAAGDPRVDLLYKERPVILSRLQLGEELTGELLPDFERKSHHRIIAQVTAGYFASGPGGHSSERWAVTFQAVEFRSHDGCPALGLNVVSAGMTSPGLSAFLTEANHEELYATVAGARVKVARLGERCLDRLRRSWRRKNFDGEVVRILKNLGRHMERLSVQRDRRTRHARIERARTDRPLAAALRDLARASAENIFVEERNSTFIVLGPRLRAHVFTPRGRLVTSMNCDGNEVKQKLKTRTWRPASEAEIRDLRSVAEALAD